MVEAANEPFGIERSHEVLGDESRSNFPVPNLPCRKSFVHFSSQEIHCLCADKFKGKIANLLRVNTNTNIKS